MNLESVSKASKKLMLKEPFYGLLLMGLNKEVSKRVPTACVAKDGINIKLVVNGEYYDKQDDNTKIAILKHELLHVGMQHLSMFDQYENKQLLNVAADLEINQYIEDELKGETWEGLDIVNGEFKGVKLPLKAGTRVYYDLLQDELDKAENKQDGGDKGDQADQGQGDEGEGNNSSEFADWFNQGGGDEEHTLWKEFDDMSEAEKKLIQKQIDHQLKDVTEAMKQKGSVPGEMQGYISKLFEQKEPVLDWKQYMRRFGTRSSKINTKKTRRKPNRRFGSGPALKINQLKRTLVAIDTSGSVSENDLAEFFNEIDNIRKAGVEITIMECDSYVHRTYEYQGGNGDVEREVMGRGGTSFQPVMDEIFKSKGKYQNLIYLTDGYAPSPERVPLIPILWIHNSNSQINEDLPGTKIQIKK